MAQNLFFVLAGILFGMANIIPGVSGGTMAVVFRVYERLISILSDPIKSIKKEWKFLLAFFLGSGIGILLFGKIMNGLLESRWRSETFLFFIGVIIGSLPMLFRNAFISGNNKVNIPWPSAIAFLVGFAVMIPMIASGNNEGAKEAAKASASIGNAGIGQMLLMLLYGVIASSTMIIPGISGSFVMLLIGVYPKLIASVAALTAFGEQASTAVMLLLPFGIGVVLGLVFVSKAIKYLLQRYSSAAYSAILGFVLGSIFCVAREVSRISVVGVVSLLAGIAVLLLFERLSPDGKKE